MVLVTEPVMAEPRVEMAMTEAIPMMIPSMVRRARILFALNPSRASRIFSNRFIASLQLILSVHMVFHNGTIPKLYGSLGFKSQLSVMCNQNNGLTLLLMESMEYIHDQTASMGIQG